MKKIIIVMSITFGIIAVFIFWCLSSDRNRIKEDFSEYEKSCTSFAEFLLNDVRSIGGENVMYWVEHNNEKYKLFRMNNNNNTEVVLSTDEESDLIHTESAFYKMTGRADINFVKVSKDHVIFQEEQYGGKLIYSPYGGIDKENRKTSIDCQIFREINNCWYAVYINGI